MHYRNHIPIWLIAGSLLLALIFASRPTAVLAQNIGAVQDDVQQNNQLLEIEQTNIRVIKQAFPISVPEPGGNVMFTVAIENLNPEGGSVTITSLVDSVYGDLNGQGSCIIPQTISLNSYPCAFPGFVSGNGGETHTSIVTAQGQDGNGNAVSGQWTTEVRIDDLIKLTHLSSPVKVSEPGGLVTFTTKITNPHTNVEPVTILTLTDTIYGDLNGRGDCNLPQVLIPDQEYSCQFQVIVTGNGDEIKKSTVTALVQDTNGNAVSKQDKTTVTIDDLVPEIKLINRASPRSVPEPGGLVTFTAEVSNPGTNVDPVTIVTLTDTIYGDLNDRGDCSLPQVLVPGRGYSCQYQAIVTGDGGESKSNKMTAEGTDDEGNLTVETAQAIVRIGDSDPRMSVLKSVSPSTLLEPGGNVVFTIIVKNDSLSSTDPITLTSLLDGTYGDLDGLGGCAVPQPLPAGQSYACTFEDYVDSSERSLEENRVTASGVDDEGNSINNSDDAIITIIDRMPEITLSQNISPSVVEEAGADVTFSLIITNVSIADSDPVNLTALTHNIYGDLQDDCSLPQMVLPSDSYACSFTRFITGDVGETKINVITVEGVDDEGNVVQDEDDATVVIEDSDSTILLIKTVDADGDGRFSSNEMMPEPGGTIEYQIQVQNGSPIDDVTISRVSDPMFGGDISANCGTGLPVLLSPGESVICAISHDTRGNTGDSITSVAVAIGQDEDGKLLSASGSAEVNLTDEQPKLNVIYSTEPISVTENGGDVRFAITIANTSVASDPVVLGSLIDDVYKDVTDYSDRDDLNSCVVPRVINSGDSYRCAFIVPDVAGNVNNIQMISTLTATGTDDENNQASGQANVTVLFKNAAPIINVIQTASPMNVPEPGEDVRFKVVIQNESNAFDPVTINSLEILSDDENDCKMPQTIEPEISYSCIYTRSIEGDPGDKHVARVTVSGEDDEGTPINEEDEIIVTVSDIAPTIVVIKSAGITKVVSSGADVPFLVVITNASAGNDSVTIDKLFDTTYGDLDGQGDCTLPQKLGPAGAENDSYSCTFTVNITGNPGDTKTSVVVAEGQDERGNLVADGDDETVSIDFLEPFLVVTNLVDTATPFGGDGVYSESEIIPEPGGPVRYRIEVENISQADITVLDVKDSTLTDQPSVDISEHCFPSPPALLPAGEKIICLLDDDIQGDAGKSKLNVVSATGINKTGHGLTDFDDSTVVIGNSPPAIQITNMPNPASVPESGGNVKFTVVISNTSLANIVPISNTDPVNIFSLQDSISGNLHGKGDCSIPQDIPAGQSYSCTYTAFVERNAKESPEIRVSVAAGTDNEGNQAIDFTETTVAIDDLLPGIRLSTKTDPNSVDEPGNNVTITVTAHNDNNRFDQLTLHRLIDDLHGNLSSQGTCILPQIIPAGDDYTCSFTAAISGDAAYSETNTITVNAQDDEKNFIQENDSATVTVDDVEPILTVTQHANPNAVLEPGENVSFTVTISNDSVTTDPVTVTTLVDDVHGNLHEQGNCFMPQMLEPDQSYSCTFSAFVAGNAAYTETNSAVATAQDNEGNIVKVQGSATVTLRNAPPTLRVTKEPDVRIVSEAGGDVTFTIEVSNESANSDPVTLTGLQDNIYGDLNGQGICTVPHTIQPSEEYVCTFTARLAGNAGDSETAIVTAIGEDDEGHTIMAEGSATVVIGNVGSLLQVTKQVDADGDGTFSDGENILEPGGTVAYRIVIKNKSTVDEVTLESVDDPPLGGDISDNCLPSLPVVMAPDSEVICTVTEELIGIAGDHLVNVVTVTGVDDEGNTLRDTADASVTIVQPKADLSLRKELLSQTLTPNLVPEQLTAIYRLRYMNQGPDPAPNVRLIDTLPSGMLIDKPPSLPFDGINLPLLTWSLGTLNPGEFGEITVTVRLNEATQGEILTNVASISCGCTDSDTSNDEGVANLVISQGIMAQNMPTAIALERFQLDITQEGINVSWTTAEEFDTSSFELYRNTSNDLVNAVPITPAPIPSKGSPGGDYHFLDRSPLSDMTYVYWLVETELDGIVNIHGPVQESITFQRSTLQGLSSDQNDLYLPIFLR